MFGRITCPYCTKDTEKQELIINDNNICGYVEYDGGLAYLKTVYVNPENTRRTQIATRRISNCPMCGRKLSGYNYMFVE